MSSHSWVHVLLRAVTGKEAGVCGFLKKSGRKRDRRADMGEAG